MLSQFLKRSWFDADWKVRQKTAQTHKDPAQLRRLALSDVSEEVRVAAVGNLDVPEILAEVVRVSECERTRREALGRIRDMEVRLRLVLSPGLPDELRALALHGLPCDVRLTGAYQPESADAFRLVLLNVLQGLEEDVFWTNVARMDPNPAVRLAACSRIRCERTLLKLYRTEQSPELRHVLSDGVKSPEMIFQLLKIETRESQRIWLASRITDEGLLKRIVIEEANPHVRQSALLRIQGEASLVEIACANVPAPVASAALARLHDDEARAQVAMRSPHEEVRAEALRPILDEEVLSRLEEEAAHPEIRWLAGRRNDSMPIKALGEIQHGPTLLRLIEMEPEPEVATWLVGRVEDQETLRVIGGSTFPGVLAARRRLDERSGPLGLRMLNVPGRPYAMSVFPVTVAQLREALGEEVAGKGADDLPAVGMSPEVALRFCDYLNKMDEGGGYRLPSLEEWRHAALTDDDNWLEAATGEFSQADVLLGKQRVAYNVRARRSARLAWPNPWGFLDAVGNVAVWVDDAARPWLHLAPRDLLAMDGDPSSPSDFAVAAGACWADSRVRKDHLARLVARPALRAYASDKVGIRVVRDIDNLLPTTTRYKLVLRPELAPGYTPQLVQAALLQRSEEVAEKYTTWRRVAPAVVLQGGNYREVRKLKNLLENCGAFTRMAMGAA